MGMFNWVRFEMPCPKCGKLLDGFQTKDGDSTMKTVDPMGISQFYESCECGAWLEFNRIDPIPESDIPIPLRPYSEIISKFKLTITD